MASRDLFAEIFQYRFLIITILTLEKIRGETQYFRLQLSTTIGDT